MKHAKILSIIASLASFGLISNEEIPHVMANDRPDIGFNWSQDCPSSKADILVVYSASWCPPCQANRPKWVQLRNEGYKVVYIDIDHPHRYDGKWFYQTSEIVDKAMETPPKVVPTLRYYNSSTGNFLDTTLTGTHSLNKIRQLLWKPSSLTDLSRAQ